MKPVTLSLLSFHNILSPFNLGGRNVLICTHLPFITLLSPVFLSISEILNGCASFIE